VLRKIQIGEHYTMIHGAVIEVMTCALIQDDRGFYFDRVPKDWEYLSEQINIEMSTTNGYYGDVKVPKLIKKIKVVSMSGC